MSAIDPAPAPLQPRDQATRRVILLTGMSGAGKSVALGVFEDLGFEVVDNLPIGFLAALVGGAVGARPLAIGIDTRTRDFSVGLLRDAIDQIGLELGAETRLVYMDCDDAVLQRRYTETRRRHPLALDRPLSDGLVLERRLLSPLKEMADLVLDSTELRPADLKRILEGHYGVGATGTLTVCATSFGFKNGLPRDADLVFDVRFLHNPRYTPELAPLGGTDPRVAAHVAADPHFEPFLKGVAGLLEPLLPRYIAEGKSYLTIAVGCTGGQHRSVTVVERLAEWLRGRVNRVEIRHRDLADALRGSA